MENGVQGFGRKDIIVILPEAFINFQFLLRISLGAFGFSLEPANGFGAFQPLFQKAEQIVINIVDALAHLGNALLFFHVKYVLSELVGGILNFDQGIYQYRLGKGRRERLPWTGKLLASTGYLRAAG